jgi:hypothetical protein
MLVILTIHLVKVVMLDIHLVKVVIVVVIKLTHTHTHIENKMYTGNKINKHMEIKKTIIDPGPLLINNLKIVIVI